MVALGKAVRNAAFSGRREMTKPMRKTPSTGRDIEGGGQRGPNPGHENRSLEATFRHPTPKLTAEEQDKAQQYIEQYPRDVRKVAYLLEQETSKRVSTKTIKRLVKKTVMSGSASKKLPRKVLIHNNMSGVKPSSSSCKIEKPVACMSYGILMSQVSA